MIQPGVFGCQVRWLTNSGILAPGKPDRISHEISFSLNILMLVGVDLISAFLLLLNVSVTSGHKERCLECNLGRDRSLYSLFFTRRKSYLLLRHSVTLITLKGRPVPQLGSDSSSRNTHAANEEKKIS